MFLNTQIVLLNVMLNQSVTSQRSRVRRLKFGYKQVNSPVNFDQFPKYSRFFVFMAGCVINVFSAAYIFLSRWKFCKCKCGQWLAQSPPLK